MGLNSRKKRTAAQVCGQGKSPRRLQTDFPSRILVTSGHTTVWQNKVTLQVRCLAMLQRWLQSCRPGVTKSRAAIRGKDHACSTTHSTGGAYKASRMLPDNSQTVAAIPSEESLQLRVNKSQPPEGRQTQHPSARTGATPRHLCLPGSLTSLLKTVQCRKALLPMYLSEGGMASSTRAAQFMKALTRIVWRVIGRRTSLRLVQCTKANSGISSTWVLQRSIFLSSRQLSHACAPRVAKCFERASAVIPVELRQPAVNSLTLARRTVSRGDGSSLKVTSARLIQLERGIALAWLRY